MTMKIRRSLGMMLTGVALLSLPACDSFLEVDNPNSLETESVDPERDARLLSQSAYQSFVNAYGEIPVYAAWYTNHARVGDTFPTRNNFGRRQIPDNNTHITNDFWNPLHESLQFARTTIKSTEAAGPTVDLARAWFVSGYAILLQAELFCEGTIAESTLISRGPMSTVALLDSAINDLRKVQEVASQVTGDGAAEAADLSMAAQVGIARAHLQAGRASEAAAAAASVPADYQYDLIHIDESSQRNLGNQTWSYSEARISLVVGPEFRAMADSGDPRIAYVDAGRLSQDGVLQFYRQDKYKGWGDAERFASGLEARYIIVEANQNPAAMLAFIQERRAFGNQPPFPATTDMDVLMTELMVQRARDFWLEGRDVADLRRNPQNAPYVLQPGDNYYKPELGLVFDEVCWPVPLTEKERNLGWS